MPITTSLPRAITQSVTQSPTSPPIGGGGATIMGDTLAPYVTFTRASTATYFDSAGVMQTAAINAPRYDYDPDTLAYRGLRVEEQRTNLLTYSEQFDNVEWPTTNFVVSANNITAPDGTTTADKITATATPASLARPFTATSTSHAFSIYVKSGTMPASANVIALRNHTTATMLTSMSFAGVQVVGSNSIRETLSDGWYRITVWATTGITVGDSLGLYFGATGTLTNGLDWYLWGAQLEAGSFATSYIPTTSTSVTRSADNAVVSDLTDIGYNPLESTIYAEVTPYGWSSGTTGSDRMIFGIDSGASSAHGLLRGSSGGALSFHDSTTYRPTPNPTWNDGAVRRVAFATSNTVTSSGAVNGTAGSVTTDTSVMDGSATKLTLGKRHSVAGAELCGHIKTLRYYPRRLSNTELQELTA